MSVKNNKKLYSTALLLGALGFITHFVFPSSLITDTLFFIAVLLHAHTAWGAKRTAIFAVVTMLIGYFAEFIGINTGWVFGPYHYNPDAPGLIFGVPFFIPMGYVTLVYPAAYLAIAMTDHLSHKRNLWLLAIMTGFIATLKDTVTDPLRSTLHHVWTWTQGGEYLGVPIHNFIGWFFVFAVITVAMGFLAMFAKEKQARTDKNFLVFPVFLYVIQSISALIAAITATGESKEIGAICTYIAVFTLTPLILVAYMNGFLRKGQKHN